MKKIILIFLLGASVIGFSTFHNIKNNELLTFISLSFLSLISSFYLRDIKLNFFIKLISFSALILISIAFITYNDTNFLLFHLQTLIPVIFMFSLGSFFDFKKYKKRSVLIIIIAIVFVSMQIVLTDKIIYKINNIDINEQQYNELPNFILVDLEGNKITQDDFKGNIIFFDFWAVTCGYCIAQFPSIEKIRNEFKDDSDIKFYLINYGGPRDNIEYIKKFVEQREIKIPVLFDSKSTFASDLNCFAFPHTFIIDKNLNIRYHHSGYQKSAEKVYIKDVINRIKTLSDE